MAKSKERQTQNKKAPKPQKCGCGCQSVIREGWRDQTVTVGDTTWLVECARRDNKL